MMIHWTINFNTIRILIPIQENFVQSQDHFEILTKDVESKLYKDLSQDKFRFINWTKKEKSRRKIRRVKRNWKSNFYR